MYKSPAQCLIFYNGEVHELMQFCVLRSRAIRRLLSVRGPGREDRTGHDDGETADGRERCAAAATSGQQADRRTGKTLTKGGRA